jgi:hypothetical protein
MDAAFYWLMVFITSQLVVIAIGLLPLSLWRSFRITAKSLFENSITAFRDVRA